MFKNFMSKKRNKKRGFTLIELIIVIAIIAILAAIAVPAFGNIRQNALVKSDIANARTIYGVVSALIADGEVDVPTKGGTMSNLESGLANAPKPQAMTGDFTFEVNEDGEITVFVGETEIYPDSSSYPVTE